MSKRSSIFNTIRTEGAILPAELLQRIVSGDPTLEGLKSTDYHLSPSERLNEAATRSWNRLIGVWQTYREILNQLPEESIGTTETRERWLLPLFQELGYGRLQTQKSIEIEDKTYPISHKASEPVAIHLVSFKWDLDKRNPIAKGETKLSPHSLMQEFLNRSEDHLWGILSNGLKLRIQRDNVSLTRAAYVEFDLQAMMDGIAYSDFFLLYLLCHQSRVEVKTDETGRALPPETCWLEKWYNSSIKDGVRALDELRNNVQSAIESLGAGFLSHPANTELRDKLRSGTLSLQDYYHQVLLQVYRLLFVFVAEDRDLLIPGDVPDMVKQTYHKYYSTYRIRELASKKRGTRHSDLWQQLNLLFNGLYDGNTALGLPPLGSFLFRASSTQEMANCEIANSDLLSAVRFLCYTQKNNIFQPINYRNLGPEELGSVYESLLEMHPEINLEAGYFKLNVVSGSERKTTGSYYTPSSLVNCLLDSALEPVIDNALKSVSSSVIPAQAGTQSIKEQAILSLKICDPACGSGHFLISAAHRLAKRLASIRAGEDEPAPSVIQHALRDVIGHCIYGVDLNLMAVELCKISLWMEALEPGKPLTFLDHHIQCGNSLLGCTPALLKKGIPDAAFTSLSGDDKTVCSIYKKLNKDESKGNIDIFSSERENWQSKRVLQPGISALNQIADDDLTGLHAKEQSYADFVQSQDYQNTKLIYDAWCAAIVWVKDGDPQRSDPITHGSFCNIQSDPEIVDIELKQEIDQLVDEYRFFHWHLAFPDVFPMHTDHPSFTKSGFDCILGNPPWDMIESKENDPDIEINKVMHTQHFISASGKYPLTSSNRKNLFAIFVELALGLVTIEGRCGLVVPTAIVTDSPTESLCKHLVQNDLLVSLYDFENRGNDSREKFFDSVHPQYKISLVTIAGQSMDTPTKFGFYLQELQHIRDEYYIWQLGFDDILRVSKTRFSVPNFKNKIDALLYVKIAQTGTILFDHKQTIKSGLFYNFDSASKRVKICYDKLLSFDDYFEVYEGEYFHAYDHRYASCSNKVVRATTSSDKSNPCFQPNTLYWVSRENVQKKWEELTNDFPQWYVALRRQASTTNETTSISTILPVSGAEGSVSCFYGQGMNCLIGGVLSSCLNSYSFNYLIRLRQGGANVSKSIYDQIPICNMLSNIIVGESSVRAADIILQLVLELVYTSYALKSFAQDCGYDGPPFIWDEERRFEIRCELDALYFHLDLGTQSDWQAKGTPELLSYLPTPRHAVEYIMETFPIVKRKDEKEYGQYRTKLRILEIYDQMTHCLATNTEYLSTLNPPPGPPCDSEGNFIPVEKWDKNNWPNHIHQRNGSK